MMIIPIFDIPSDFPWPFAIDSIIRSSIAPFAVGFRDVHRMCTTPSSERSWNFDADVSHVREKKWHFEFEPNKNGIFYYFIYWQYFL